MGSARRAAISLAVLTVLAFSVRTVGIDFGAPLWEEGDAYFAGHVDLLRKGVELSRRSEDNVQYPSLVPHCVALWPARPPAPSGAGLEEHLHAARGTFVQVRTFIALLGILTVPLTYRLARRTVGRGWAVLAAAVPAASLVHLNFSQQARPHVALTTLFLATILACLHLRRRPTTASYLLAGTAAALSIGCLHSGFIMLLPLLAAHVFADRPAGRSRWFDPRLLLTVPLIALSVRFFYAYAFDQEVRESKQVFRIEGDHVYMSTHKLSLEMWNGSGLASLFRILRTWDPELLVFLAVGVVGWVLARRAREPRRTRPGDGWVLAAFLVPYLTLLTAYSRTYERFLIPLLPFVAAFSVWGAARVAARLAPAGRAALVAVLVASLGGIGYASARWAWVRSQPGTLELASEWVRDHTAADERVFVFPPYDLAVSRTDAGFRRADGRFRTPRYSVWSRYQVKLDESERPPPLRDVRWMVLQPEFGDLTQPANMEAWLDAQGPGVYVLQVAVGKRASRFDPVLRRTLGERGTLEARFSPDARPDFSEHPLADEDEEVDDWPSFLRRVLVARASGPVMEVYRVP